MSDSSSGYVADIGYTYGYYQELNPERVKLAFLNAGMVAPEFGSAYVTCPLEAYHRLRSSPVFQG